MAVVDGSRKSSIPSTRWQIRADRLVRYGGGEHVGGGLLGEQPQPDAELGALAGDGQQRGLEAFAGLAARWRV
ncbi:hypothetical protein [Streptomyces sp. NPDC090022]|uniref:hypothetical protein n=1 Tax=Streptomyces sp. NPDC090022 TaxID=3365920 RepID=UPI0037F5237E